MATALGSRIAPDHETDLIDRLRRDDPQAVAELVERYSAMLFGLICRIIRDQHVAEDALQEAFVKIWRSFGQYDEKKGALATWLISVARSTAIDRVRSRSHRDSRKNRPLHDLVHEIEGRDHAETYVDGIGLHRLLDALPMELRQVLDLVYYGGCTHSEAARELALPLGTVKTRLRSAIISLRAANEHTESRMYCESRGVHRVGDRRALRDEGATGGGDGRGRTSGRDGSRDRRADRRDRGCAMPACA